MSLRKIPIYLLGSLMAFVMLGGFGWYVKKAFRQSLDGACLDMKPDARLSIELPKFRMKDLQGQWVSKSDLQGKTLLLHFFASWCLPCLEEMPHIAALSSAMSSKKDSFRIVVIGEDEDIKALAQFFPGKTDFIVLYDEDHQLQRHFRVERFPETFLVDENSILRYQFKGPRLSWSFAEAKRCVLSVGGQ